MLVPAAAAAQSPDARAKFERGLAEMVAGKYDSGCPLIAEANALEPRRPGVMFTLAECEARWGKNARALADYEAYLGVVATLSESDKEQQHERPSVAERQAAQLRQLLGAITIEAPGASLDCDGAPAVSGSKIWLEPGSHRVHARFSDGREADRTLNLRAGQSERVELAPPALTSTPPVVEEPKPKSSGNSLKTAAIVVGGVGAAGVIVGVVSGLMLIGSKSVINGHCGLNGDPSTVCDTQANADTANGAKVQGWVSTIGFAAGAIGIATAAVLFVVASKKATVDVRTSGLGLDVRARW